MSLDHRVLAAGLICAVHDDDQPEIDRVLDQLDDYGRRQLTLYLARCIDPERPLGDLVPADTYVGTVGRIVGIVERRTFVTGSEIYGRRKYREVAAARQVVCWVAAACGMSSVQIGRAIDRDHATVLHAMKRVSGDRGLLEFAESVLSELIGESRAA